MPMPKMKLRMSSLLVRLDQPLLLQLMWLGLPLHLLFLRLNARGVDLELPREPSTPPAAQRDWWALPVAEQSKLRIQVEDGTQICDLPSCIQRPRDNTLVAHGPLKQSDVLRFSSATLCFLRPSLYLCDDAETILSWAAQTRFAAVAIAVVSPRYVKAGVKEPLRIPVELLESRGTTKTKRVLTGWLLQLSEHGVTKIKGEMTIADQPPKTQSAVVTVRIARQQLGAEMTASLLKAKPGTLVNPVRGLWPAAIEKHLVDVWNLSDADESYLTCKCESIKPSWMHSWRRQDCMRYGPTRRGSCQRTLSRFG